MSFVKSQQQQTPVAKTCSSSSSNTNNSNSLDSNACTSAQSITPSLPKTFITAQNNFSNFTTLLQQQQQEQTNSQKQESSATAAVPPDNCLLMTKNYDTASIKTNTNEEDEDDNRGREKVKDNETDEINEELSYQQGQESSSNDEKQLKVSVSESTNEFTSPTLNTSLQTHRSSTSSSSSNSAPVTTIDTENSSSALANSEQQSNSKQQHSQPESRGLANLSATSELSDNQQILLDTLEAKLSSVSKTPSPIIPSNSPSRKNSKGQLSKTSSVSKFSTASECGKCDEDTISKTSDTSGELVRGIPTVNDSSTSDSKSKNTTRLSERAKKKSWYNVLYPNYKSRAEDFKKLFKEVPNERLIVDYSCALQRDILVQGRLYVSQNYVCFHANIFSWETYLSLKWKDVTAITKEKTALVIPNAISICTAKEKYFFATFAARDKAFLMLFRVWQNTLMNKQLQPQEIWQIVHNYYGEELGLTSDDEDYIDPTTYSNDTELELDFISALEDPTTLAAIGTGSTTAGTTAANKTNSVENLTASQIQAAQTTSGSGGGGGGGNSSTSSGSGVRKSKSKSYFFNSSKKNSSTTASASASGSDNKASDSKSNKSNSKMKANSKELTLTSAKSDESLTAGSQAPGTVKYTSDQNVEVTLNSTNSPANSVSKKDQARPTSAATAESKRKLGKKKEQRDEILSKTKEPIPTDHSDSSGSEQNSAAPFVATTECTSTHEGRQLLHTLLPINVDSVFNLLFSKSKFLIDLHAARNSADLDLGEWSENNQGQKVRTVNVTVQVAASVGPKTARVTEEQVMRDCSKPGELYSIDITSTNAGIPYADSFCVLMHFCLVRTADDHTMLSVHGQIKYTKSIWAVVKGFIEKNTWAGLEDFYADLLTNLQSETRLLPAKGKGRRPRRGTRPVEEAPVQNKAEITEVAKPQITPPHAVISQALGVVTQSYTRLSVFVLVLIGLLVAFNVLLLVKLWKLEERVDYDLKLRSRMPNLSYLSELPNTHEEWLNLVRQQEILHETELRKWHKVLQTAIELLKKTEKTLAELMFH